MGKTEVEIQKAQEALSGDVLVLGDALSSGKTPRAHLAELVEKHALKDEAVLDLETAIVAAWAEVPIEVKQDRMRAAFCERKTPKQIAFELLMDLHQDVLPVFRSEGAPGSSLEERREAHVAARSRTAGSEPVVDGGKL